MIDFSTLQGLEIPEGKVVQIEDAAGNVLWVVQSESNGPIVLEVEKITSNTYAGETAYTDESFILLDIYPKTNGTVSITYGGLTKTVTDTSGAAEPNAQQVFFGTFNGVSDEVETPVSGTLTIEGDFSAFACGSYYRMKNTSVSSSCIMDVVDWANPTIIAAYAFDGCTKFTLTELPSGVTSIGVSAFRGCTGISIGEIPEGVTSIGDYAFSVGSEHNMPNPIILPSTITSIGSYAFSDVVSGLVTPIAKKIIIRATEPPTIGVSPFGEYDDSLTSPVDRRSTIVVPKGCLAAYTASEYWSEYLNRIMEES